MIRHLLLPATILLLGGCMRGVGPWPIHSAPAPKPESPLRAPPDSGLLVISVDHPQDYGGFTIFDRNRSYVAQFDEDVVAWTTVTVPPGLYSFFLRTWISDFCGRRDVMIEAGKVYLLALNSDDLGGSKIGIRARFIKPEAGKMPGGRMHANPYVVTDLGAARAELAERAGDVAQCILKADAALPSESPAHVGGWDEIDFAVPAR